VPAAYCAAAGALPLALPHPPRALLVKVDEGGGGWGRAGRAIKAVNHEERRGMDHDEDGPLRVVGVDHHLDRE